MKPDPKTGCIDLSRVIDEIDSTVGPGGANFDYEIWLEDFEHWLGANFWRYCWYEDQYLQRFGR